MVTTPKNRRGDIHSSINATPAPRRHRRVENGNEDLNSDGTHMNLPSSSAPQLSMPDAPTDEPAEIRAIWGTTVNLAETMKSFREFMLGFKPKYRVSYDKDRGVRTRNLSNEEGEMLLYETYLRRMRQTGQTNLNLDMLNLAAYPPSRKLYTQLIKYPQEVVPAMDQVLKDLMLEIAEQDRQAELDGMAGGDGEEEIAEIMSKVYKIRPFGIQSANMRELNPTGATRVLVFNHNSNLYQIRISLCVSKV